MIDELQVFSDINIKYYPSFDRLVIKCENITKQLETIKKVLKIIIFKIQSKEIKKNYIIIEINNEDFIKDDIIILLNIMKLTKTTHYFNIVVKNGLESRISAIKNQYMGIKINEGI